VEEKEKEKEKKKKKKKSNKQTIYPLQLTARLPTVPPPILFFLITLLRF
jgi:hypothetical protein